MLVLSEQEKARLRKLNQDMSTVESLKKLFLNAFIKKTAMPNTEVLAAERIAIELLGKGFEELARIQPKEEKRDTAENIV